MERQSGPPYTTPPPLPLHAPHILPSLALPRLPASLQLEEDLGDDYRWSYRVSEVLFSGRSEFQEIDLVDTPTWGKVRGVAEDAAGKRRQ